LQELIFLAGFLDNLIHGNLYDIGPA